MAHSHRTKLAIGVGLMVLAVGVSGSEFRGCADGPADVDAGLLPESEICFVDADCVSEDMCIVQQCLSGTCVPAGPAVDGDGDGFAPIPCGEDCNDFDARTFPGAAELCDRVDQDCDGSIDEDATGSSTHPLSDGLTEARITGFGAGFAVVGPASSGDPGLFAYQVGTDGRAMAVPAQVLAATPDDFAMVAAGGALMLVATGGDGAPARLVELSPSAGAFSETSSRDLGTVQDVRRVAAIELGGEAWFAFDADDPGGATSSRYLVRQSDPDTAYTLHSGSTETAGPALAHTGDMLVATASENRLLFLWSDGSVGATQTLAGRFADRPIASGAGFVYAAYHDAFDRVVTRVTSTSISSPSTAPSGDRDDEVSIYVAPPNVLVTRFGAALGLRAWVLEPDLRTFVTTFNREQLAPGSDLQTTVTAATSASGVSAILSSYDGNATLAVLSCDGG